MSFIRLPFGIRHERDSNLEPESTTTTKRSSFQFSFHDLVFSLNNFSQSFCWMECWIYVVPTEHSRESIQIKINGKMCKKSFWRMRKWSNVCRSWANKLTYKTVLLKICTASLSHDLFKCRVNNVEQKRLKLKWNDRF